MYYFEGKYYRRNNQNIFTSLTSRDAERELRYHGFGNSKAHNEASEIDVALRDIQFQNSVQGAGPLCGRQPGLVSENGFNFLVTRGPQLIEGYGQEAEERAKPLLDLLKAVFGSNENPHFEEQFLVFFGWLQRARKALMNPGSHLPGQMLLLVGPAGCGKSYLQSMITKMLGNRKADPSLWLQDKTSFNGNLWEAEHLIMSDSNLDPSGREKNTMRDKIKEIVANPTYPCHQKGREQMTLRAIWRMSLSANDDVVSANILPALENSTRDKLIYFMCYESDGYFPAEDLRDQHHQSILNALPAFLHLVDNFEIPTRMRSERWGVRAWHHPKCVELLQSYNPEQEIEEIFEQYIKERIHTTTRKRPRELYEELDIVTGGKLHRCSKSTKHLGHQIARLCERKPWSSVITKITEREGPNRSERVYYRISPKALTHPEKDDEEQRLL